MPPKIVVRKVTSRKNSSWKELKKRRTLSHRLQLVALSLVGIVVAAFFFGGLSLVQFLKAPLSLASGSFPEGRVWDKTSPLNLILVVTDDRGQNITKLAMLTADKYQNSLSVVSLPTEAVVEYPLGLGTAPLSQAIIFGDSLSPKVAVGMLSSVLKKILAVPIDRYCILSEASLAQWNENPTEFKEMLRIKNMGSWLTNLQFVKDNVSTNLSLGEMGELLWFLRQMSPSNIFIKDFGTEIGIDRIDAWWADFLSRGLLKQERVPVLVLNGTDKEGLGSWGGRLVQNLGGDTLTFANSQGKYPTSFIITDNPELPVVKALGRALNVSSIQTLKDGQEYESGRARVTVVLGLDMISTQ